MTSNLDDPQPYPNWPGTCGHFGCETPHPCPLFHDPMACDEAPRDGCGCDLEALVGTLPTAPDADEELNPAEDLGPEPERVYDDDPDTVQVYLEVDDPEPTPPAPEPWKFAPHPIYDQLLAELTYPELTA